MNEQMKGVVKFLGKPTSSQLEERSRSRIERWISNKLKSTTRTAIYSVSFIFLTIPGEMDFGWVGCEIQIEFEGRKTFYSRDMAPNEMKALQRAISHLRPKKGELKAIGTKTSESEIS